MTDLVPVAGPARVPLPPGPPPGRAVPTGPHPAGYPIDGEVIVEIDGQRFGGWSSVRVTRGVERVPSDFDIGATEPLPLNPAGVALPPGQVCRISIGGDLVLTGYIDRYGPEINANGHRVRLSGRNACADLVDNMAWLPRGVLNSTSVRKVVEAVAAAYGVKTVFRAAADVAIPQLMVTLGETCWDVIEQVTRYGAMLPYDDVSGNLVLAQVGTGKMASGIQEGLNVLTASPLFSVDQRFTEYHTYLLSTDTTADYRNGAADPTSKVVVDKGMLKFKRPDGQLRVRRHAIVGEQIDANGSLLERRANWELARRLGRSQVVRVEVDSWRDTKGRLWEPNMLAPVNLPSCKVRNATMVIGEVNYLRDERGTRCAMILMPPAAYTPAPVVVSPFDWQVARETAGGGGSNAARPSSAPSRDAPRVSTTSATAAEGPSPAAAPSPAPPASAPPPAPVPAPSPNPLDIGPFGPYNPFVL